MCADHQTGKAGVHEWGDPTCPLPALKSGLCLSHYQRWYRHRRAAGLNVTTDHQPGASCNHEHLVQH